MMDFKVPDGPGHVRQTDRNSMQREHTHLHLTHTHTPILNRKNEL